MHQDHEKSINGEVSSPRISTNYVDMASMEGGHEHRQSRHSRQSRNSARRSEAEQHRDRFLSNSERLLVEHPQEARESLASLDASDAKHWHLTPINMVLKNLNTTEENGLTSAEVERRIEQYGLNKLEEEPRPPIWVIFLLQFYNLIVGLLIIATICSLFIGHYVEAVAIFFILNLNALIATIQERNTGNALEALASMSSPMSMAIRDGQKQQVESAKIVPGDIITLTTGDIVPADIRLIKSTDLKVNEMLLTGESEDVAKKYNAGHNAKKLTADNMVFSSTTVTAGNAIGVVVETGMSTRVGSIAMLLKSKDGSGESKNCITRFVAKHQPKLTPLQHSLHKLGFVMGSIALFVCAIVFTTGIIRGTKNPRDLDMPTALFMVMVSVSLAVSAVPEGLPMVVTICLTSGTSEMVKKNVLVRKIAAVETLGAASVICTDKTGTLTEGKMTAIKMYGDFTEYDITGKGFTPEGAIYLNDVNQGEISAGNVQVRSTLLACVLCSNTHLKQKVNEDGNTVWVPMGNSSEAPLVVAAAKAGIWEEYVAEEYKRVVEVPFSSSRKMMITVNSVPDSCKFDIFELPQKTKYVANVKGAPNYIMKNCTRFMTRNGELMTLNDEHREKIMQAVDDLSSKALRVLAVAIRPLEKLPFSDDCDDVEEKFAALSQPLVFVGLMASIDPERDGVREAIQTARRASVRTVMITGDYLKTAIAIAKNIDLLIPGADVEAEATDCSLLRPNGDQYLPETELDAITSRTVVFARAKPEDKIEIVKSLQRQGLISAMTGDGVNDAPALKESDIGVAMGITGTEVAKGASDMILLDDNFCSIVAAVEKGRIIYANIQKFVIFLLSTNIGEIIFIFSTVAAGLFLPLEPIQILMLNLFSDGMPAVALSLEKGDSSVMEDSPRPKSQPLIHGRLWVLVMANALLIASGAFGVFVTGVYMNFGILPYKEILKTGFGALQYKEDGVQKTSTIGVTCRRWEGKESGWKTYGNQYAVKVGDWLKLSESKTDRDVFQPNDEKDYNCLKEGIARSQTIAFACITFTEVFRAYTVRSFTEPVWVGIFSNKYLQFAAIASAILTLSIANIPVVMSVVFGFEYIPYWHWLFAVGGALCSVIGGELIKTILRRKLRAEARDKAMHDGFENVLNEIRTIRAQLDRLEHRE